MKVKMLKTEFSRSGVPAQSDGDRFEDARAAAIVFADEYGSRIERKAGVLYGSEVFDLNRVEPHERSVTEADAERARGQDCFAIQRDKFKLFDGSFQWNELEVGWIHGDHYTVVTLFESIHGTGTEPETEDTVLGIGRTASQEVTENHGTSFLARQWLELLGDEVANSAEPFHSSGFTGFHAHIPTHRFGALGDDNDCMLA